MSHGVVSSAPDREVVVLGGGPAGLAAALAARRAGIERVTVVDRSNPPIDKACGEGLMPDALVALGRLGVDTGSIAGQPIRGIRYLECDRRRPAVAEATFPGPPGRGVRRIALHRALVDAAERAGVELLWSTPFEGLDVGSDGASVRLAGESGTATLRATWVIGADGLRSRVRRWAGLAGEAPRSPSATERFGVRCHFRLRPWTDHVEVYWAPEGEAYVTPVGDEEVGVAILWSRGHGPGGFDRLLTAFPELSTRLRDVERVSQAQGVGPLRQRSRGSHRGAVALVGDAAGYLDAITGEGLAIAFHQAVALGEALQRRDLAAYGRADRTIRRLPEAMTRLLLFVERRPWLRHRMIAALRADPELFQRFLGVHSRALPWREVGFGGAARLAWRLALPGAT